LRLIWFFPLLSTPPRGDAVTSSSQTVNGPIWPGSFTREDHSASQRTGMGFQPMERRTHGQDARATISQRQLYFNRLLEMSASRSRFPAILDIVCTQFATR